MRATWRFVPESVRWDLVARAGRTRERARLVGVDDAPLALAGRA